MYVCVCEGSFLSFSISLLFVKCILLFLGVSCWCRRLFSEHMQSLCCIAAEQAATLWEVLTPMRQRRITATLTMKSRVTTRVWFCIFFFFFKSTQVQAPGLPDLTLIDLPGIVRTATKGQRTSVMSEVNGLIQRCVLKDLFHSLCKQANGFYFKKQEKLEVFA